MLPEPALPAAQCDLLSFAVDYYRRKQQEWDTTHDPYSLAMLTGVYCTVQALLIHAGYSNVQIDDLLADRD